MNVEGDSKSALALLSLQVFATYFSHIPSPQSLYLYYLLGSQDKTYKPAFGLGVSSVSILLSCFSGSSLRTSFFIRLNIKGPIL